ncbi:MAG: phosphoribosylglycinamide formyltransferase [Campylobacterales bacterium]|nr:phosphoribosylglycinamide formyltransferase [Campylobacterales bacterium]HEO98430.1 phosphoribosylglycinamide formyltransferase [Campylobacterota bacterium]
MRSMKRIAVLFSGTGSNFAHIISTLHKKEAEIAVALTNNPEAEGIRFAKAHGIPLEVIDSKAYENREAFDSAVVERLRSYQVDLTVLAGFMRILTPVFTDRIKCINLHPSLLPRHKGMKAIERSYEDEYPTGGVSVHWVTSELDGGEIILQKEVAKEGLCFEVYYEKVRAIEKVALEEAIRKVLS